MAERLSEKAYRLIKEKIITLELPPSELIDEPALMEELGLGRTPIREALLQLESESLVTILPRRGLLVAGIKVTDLQQIFEVRMVLESFCARLAAQRITEEQMAEMEAILQDLERVPDGDARALMDVDERVHTLMYQAAGNEFLADVLNRLYFLSLRLWYLALDRLGDVRAAIEQHRDSFEALRARDGARAEAFIQQHMVEFQRKIKAVL